MPETIDDYAENFNSLDANAIVEAYRFPLCVITPEESFYYKSPEDFKPVINGLLQVYRLNQFSHARIVSNETSSQIGDIWSIDIDWNLVDKNGDTILNFQFTYFQHMGLAGKPFIGVISHNEMSRWKEKMARPDKPAEHDE